MVKSFQWGHDIKGWQPQIVNPEMPKLGFTGGYNIRPPVDSFKEGVIEEQHRPVYLSTGTGHGFKPARTPKNGCPLATPMFIGGAILLLYMFNRRG